MVSRNRWWRLAASMALCLVGPIATAEAATYYISPSGSDARNCVTAQTIGTPKATFGSGVTCLSPGDTLLVRAGNYNEAFTSSTLPSGTSWSNKIRIAAYPGETVALKPMFGNYVMHLTAGEHYIEFDGINLDGRGTAGPDVVYMPTAGASHHMRFQNAEVIGSPTAGYCANICGGESSEFINLTIHGGGEANVSSCGTPCSNYGLYTGGANNLVENCDIYGVTAQGIQIYNSGGYTFSNNNIIRNNRIHDIILSGDANPGARMNGIMIAGGTNNLLYNNVIYNIGRSDGNGSNSGIQVYGGPNGTKIWNNTLYSIYGIGIGIDSGVLNTVVQNNIIYLSSGAALSNSGGGTVQSNNLVGVNPGFVSASGGNFRLSSTSSPAYNAGVALAQVTSDLAGVARPQGAAPDIGAYEYVVAGPVPAAPTGLRVVPD